jgi:hypothetical protein
MAILGVTLAGALLAGTLHAAIPNASGAIAAGVVSLAVTWGAFWMIAAKFDLGLRECITAMFPRFAARIAVARNKGG